MDNFSFTPLNGGRFISRGKGRHAVRTIDSNEIIFVIKGTLTMFEETRFFDLHAGDYLLLHRGRKHGGILDYPPGLSFFWLHFNSNGDFPENMPPSGPAGVQELARFDAAYLGNTEEKTIYLTFDAGYENGCTSQILDVLKDHNVPAAFFLVGNYMEKNISENC